MKKIFLFALLSMILTSCFSIEDDLVGTWDYSYTEKSEGLKFKFNGELIFNDDGTFVNTESTTMILDYGFLVKGRWETFMNNVKMTYDLSTLEMTGAAALETDIEDEIRQKLYIANKTSEWVTISIENGCWSAEQDDGSIITFRKRETIKSNSESTSEISEAKNVSTSNNQAEKNFIDALLRLIISDSNYSGMTQNTLKSQLGFPNDMFNQISNGPGYKIYEVDLADVECADNTLMRRQIYKVSSRTETVEVFAQHFVSNKAKILANNIKTELEKKIGEKMFSNDMTIDIGEGWSVKGYQFFSMSGTNSYAIAYDGDDLLFIVGFSAASMGDFLGIPFGD